jgi:putative flippase GtrA
MNLLTNPSSVLRRWLVFHAVGAMGVVVQMGILLTLTSGLKMGYLPATGIAVEVAVLHNFFWHERWTWAHRTWSRESSLFHRLLGFHLTNGALSIAGNLILTRFLVEELGLKYLCANALAISLCSILNFLASDRLVFRASGIFSKQRRHNHDS